MRFLQLTLLVVAVLLLIASTSTPVQAQVPAGCGNINYWLGGGAFGGDHLGRYFSSPYAMGRIPTPPYFALHPPVYYSRPVPRTYGYSPFAYPGIIATPEIVEPTPEEVINPHVKPSAKAEVETTKNRTAKVQSRTIINPYVSTPGLKAGVELASLVPSGDQ
jgi:hypothetical protein